MDDTVTGTTYGSGGLDLYSALDTFYTSYVVPTAQGSFRVIQSFSYGEMTIAVLIALLVILYGLHWLWEVLR